MTVRSVPEWIGATADSKVPDRVAERVCKKHADRCQGPCGLKFGGKLTAHMDHVVALINWTGEGHGNRESNLQPLCQFCHAMKTKIDVAAKSLTAKLRKSHLGIKSPSPRPVPGSKNSPWARRYNKATKRFQTVLR
jgi:5-methylcytosine-specific restriction enzyme A